jgi:hypothetical protein
MKRPVPDWLPKVTWFVAGIFATGAFWYFLSKDDYVATALSAIGAASFVIISVVLHRANDRSARFKEVRERLTALLKDAEALIARKDEEPLPVAEVNDWIDRATKEVETLLDVSYAARLNNFTGFVFYTDRSEKSKYRNALDGRMRRLMEFLKELQD